MPNSGDLSQYIYELHNGYKEPRSQNNDYQLNDLYVGEVKVRYIYYLEVP